jgi:hypothetical protein
MSDWTCYGITCSILVCVTRALRDRAVGAQAASEVENPGKNTGKTPKAVYKNAEFVWCQGLEGAKHGRSLRE